MYITLAAAGPSMARRHFYRVPGHVHSVKTYFVSLSQVLENIGVTDPMSAFALFTRPSVISAIANCTDTEAVCVLGVWKESDSTEITALLGFLMSTGAMKRNI